MNFVLAKTQTCKTDNDQKKPQPIFDPAAIFMRQKPLWYQKHIFGKNDLQNRLSGSSARQS